MKFSITFLSVFIDFSTQILNQLLIVFHTDDCFSGRMSSIYYFSKVINLT